MAERWNTALNNAGPPPHGAGDAPKTSAAQVDRDAGKPDNVPAPLKPGKQAGPLASTDKRPAGDTRDAKQIIADSPLLAGLGDREKQDLKHRVGDYENDPDAAYRAALALNHIEHYDEDGKAITGDTVGNNEIDGFTRAVDGDAQHRTEAGRFKDFVEQGYGTLKDEYTPAPPLPELPQRLTSNMVRPKDDTRTADQIKSASPLLTNLDGETKKRLKDKVGDFDTDADAAYRAVAVLDHIEKYADDGTDVSKQGAPVGNGRIDGYDLDHSGELTPEDGSEASRLESFLSGGYDTLKEHTASADWQEGDMKALSDDLTLEAEQKVVDDAKLPPDRQDMVNHPEKYTSEQRAAAKIELTLAMQRIAAHPDEYDNPMLEIEAANAPENQDKTPGTPKMQLPHDAQTATQKLADAAAKLDSPDVDKCQADLQFKAMQDVARKDPARFDKVKTLYNDMKNDASGLDQFIASGSSTIDAMREYSSIANTLNIAVGSDGKTLDDNVKINTTNSTLSDKVLKSYADDFRNPDTLTKLIKGGLSEQEAVTELNSRGALFAEFGSPMWELSASVKDNIVTQQLDGATPDQFQASGIVGQDGELDEAALNQVIDKLRKDDPQNALLYNVDADPGKSGQPQPLSNAQIVTSVRGLWDAFRNAAKANSALGKAELTFGQFLKSDNPIAKTYKLGALHGVSGLLAGAIAVARIANVSQMSTNAKIAAVGNGVQALGLTAHGALQYLKDTTPLPERWRTFTRGAPGQASTELTPLDPAPENIPRPPSPDGMPRPSTGEPSTTPDGTPRPSTGEPPSTTPDGTPRPSTGEPPAPPATDPGSAGYKTKILNILDFSKLVTGAGGAAAGGAGIAMGIERLQAGDKAGAGIYLTQGIANFGTSLGPIAEVAIGQIGVKPGWVSIANNAKLFAFTGSIATALNVATVVASIGYEIYDIVDGTKKRIDYSKSFASTLRAYGITEQEPAMTTAKDSYPDPTAGIGSSV